MRWKTSIVSRKVCDLVHFIVFVYSYVPRALCCSHHSLEGFSLEYVEYVTYNRTFKITFGRSQIGILQKAEFSPCSCSP